MDIVIYTNPDTLEHKRGMDGMGPIYYWEMSRVPKNFKEGDRIYFAVKGKVEGSFECISFNPERLETIEWYCNSWKELKKSIPTKQFRGFRYRWW